MSKISLHAQGVADVTVVPNIFIDQYMPSSNGAYVKVYLYLLRCFSGNAQEVTISSIADRLENTEKDILRALLYWEKLNLITLARDDQKEITAIYLMDLNVSMSDTSIPSDSDTELDEIAISIHTETKPATRKSYSAKKIEQFTNNDDIKYAMNIVEIYLDRPLKPMDLQLILYLYEELHFSAELIMYLYEYCVSKGKKSASYMEAVALTWAENGIDTEEKAKEATASYNDHFNTVNKAFGLNRAPGQIERQYITKWVEVFGFSDEIIEEACNRTLLRTQKPDFKYTDRILETWFKKDVKSHTDISRLDEEFSKGNKSNEAKKAATTVKPNTTNRFNQFPQRTYSAQDYAELERKLLNKNL